MVRFWFDHEPMGCDQPGPAAEGDDPFAQCDRGAGAPGRLQKRQRPPARMDEKSPAGKRRREENKEEMNIKRTLPWFDPFSGGSHSAPLMQQSSASEKGGAAMPALPPMPDCGDE